MELRVGKHPEGTHFTGVTLHIMKNTLSFRD